MEDLNSKNKNIKGSGSPQSFFRISLILFKQWNF